MDDLEALLQTKPGGRAGTEKKKTDDHFENAVAALVHAQHVWKALPTPKKRVANVSKSLLNSNEMLKAAAEHKRKKQRETRCSEFLAESPHAG